MQPVLLTFDLEYWFESLSIQKYLTGKEDDSLANFIDKLLFLLAQTNSRATFFVTGKVLTKEPGLIKKINQAGHEVAMHSIDHRPLWDKNPQEFEIEIKTLQDKIKQITGQSPIGHRAVNFSLNSQTAWALKILAQNNFKYDSSLFPYKFSPILLWFFKDALYGIKNRLFKPYKIDLNNFIKVDIFSPLVEFPASVFHLGGFKLPLTGGIYIRLIPWFIFKFLLKIKLKKEPACIHFHSFDFEVKESAVKMSVFKKFIKYYNTKNTWKKLEYILNKFECISIKSLLCASRF